MHFNPRSHERSDTEYELDHTIPYDISIHAPTRGATWCYSYVESKDKISIHAPTRGATSMSGSSLNQYRFQSTLPREERQRITKLVVFHQAFQSTLPREERLPPVHSRRFLYDFNPRSHERSDTMLIHLSIGSVISIHAPTRGATRTGRIKASTGTAISIHAPTRGATIIICG